MQYNRIYKGLNIQIEGSWSEDNQSNLYRWRVTDSQRVIPLEGKQPFRDWMEAYNDATAAIDAYTTTRESMPVLAHAFTRRGDPNFLKEPKPYRDCSEEEKALIHATYGGPLPDDALVHIERNTLVVANLNLETVAAMWESRYPSIFSTKLC